MNLSHRLTTERSIGARAVILVFALVALTAVGISTSSYLPISGLDTWVSTVTIPGAWETLIPLAIFLVTLRVWQGSARAVGREASPDPVRGVAAPNAELDQRGPRVVTNVQRRELNTALAEQPAHIHLVCNPLDPETVQYAQQIAAALRLSMPLFTNEVAADLKGIVIRVKNEHSPPRAALRIARAFRNAGLACRFGVHPHAVADYCDVAIGGKDLAIGGTAAPRS